ncbi:hypothetical protein [Sciscionella sediminilitoris]|uniref:hypothetical protein n=1 Tax=Sciscionella sediminilitoris TaxID=1445613 RepID=UPI0004DF1CF5|nr:hypothetical protein [Sciscionella sp. SE31]
MSDWGEVLAPLDDQVSVERDALIEVLRWLEEQPTPVMVTAAELRLQRQLMASVPYVAPQRVPASRHAVRVALTVCSALVLVGVGIAWLLLGATR